MSCTEHVLRYCNAAKRIIYGIEKRKDYSSEGSRRRTECLKNDGSFLIDGGRVIQGVLITSRNRNFTGTVRSMYEIMCQNTGWLEAG